MAVVTVLVFLAVQLIPGDYVDIVLPPQATEQQRAALIEKYGLDDPIVVQYLEWLRHVVVGDFGVTLGTNTAIGPLLATWIPVTVQLAVMSTAFALLGGIPLAIAGGMASGRGLRGASRFTSALAMSTPDFVIASILIYLFSRYQLGLPVGAYVPFRDDPLASIQSMILPALSLGVFGVAMVARTGRDAVSSVLSSAHILAATSRGMQKARLIRDHILRNSAIPVLTVVAAYCGYLLGGSVIVENLFGLPGLGQAVANGIRFRDFPVVQAVVLVAAAAFITINMLADLAYGLIDPRVRSKAQ